MAEPRRNTRVAKTAKTKPMDEYGHLQPQAPELEEAVLGALMIEKDAYSLVSEILRPESFYEHRHQLIYAAITDLAIQQKPIDILTVAEQLRSRGNLEEAGGPFYITQLSGKVASSAHIEYHARIIAQKFLARELISFTSNIQTKAFDETQDVDDLMQEAEGKLFEISQQNMKKDYTQINPVIQEAYEMLQTKAMPGILISVSAVRISPDMSIARVYLSVFPSEKAEEMVKNINENMKSIRFELGTRVRHQLRIIPELKFFVDDSLDYIEKIDSLLK